MKLTFQLDFTSDYHVAAGFGLGAHLDSALFRDADGVPALRGTLLAGLLRDAFWSLLRLGPLRAHALCDPTRKADSPPPYCSGAERSCPMCRILGSPASPKAWSISSARPLAIRQPLSPRPRPGEAAQVAFRVRVDPRTRRAQPRKLFSQEEGDAALHFVFDATCLAPLSAEQVTDAAWLVAAARFVRRLGLGRRRGRGACRIVVIKVEPLPSGAESANVQQFFLDLFRTAVLEGQPIPGTLAMPSTQLASADVVRERHESTGKPIRLRLIVRTDEPLAVARRAEAGNTFDALPYVPGTILLGALAAHAAARSNLRDAALYDSFIALFRRGEVRSTPLYPALRTDLTLYPTIPAPFDLLTCKYYGGFRKTDLSVEHGAFGVAGAVNEISMCPCPQCAAHQRDVSLVRMEGFLPLREWPEPFLPEKREELHIRTQPGTGQVEHGGLYGYTAIASGQFLVGELSCADERAFETLCTLSDIPGLGRTFSLRLGKATRRGYGRVTAWLDPLDGAPPFATAVDLGARVTALDAPIVMTLLSDAILPDPWGRFRQSLDAEWLKKLLGVDLDVGERVFCAAGTVDGFNAHLGLPRWRDIALRAGSSVGFEIKASVNFDALCARLRTLEAEGIGLRRAEGFGRIAFNHPVYRACAGVSGTGIGLDDSMGLQDGSGFTQRQERRALEAWSDEIDRAFSSDKLRVTFSDPHWHTVARWLRREAPHRMADITAALTALGTHGVPHEGMPSGRDKTPFFADPKKGKDGLAELRRWLDRLAGESSLSPYTRRLCVEALAERITALAAGKEKRS